MKKTVLTSLSLVGIALCVFLFHQPLQGEDSTILSENYEAVVQEEVRGTCSGGEGICFVICDGCGQLLEAVGGKGSVIRAHGNCPVCGYYISIGE